MNIIKNVLTTFALSLSVVAPSMADNFPNKPVTIVVGYSPGGSNDKAARDVGHQLGEMWGHSVIVDNRPGASGSIAANYVAQARGDGHTLLLGPVTLTMTSAVEKDLPYDLWKSFEPVALIATSPLAFTVGADATAQNIHEFIEEAKKTTKFAATTGHTDVNTFATYSLMQASGTKIDMINYKGAELFVDLFANRIDGFFGSVAAVTPHVQSQKLRALAVTGQERSAVLSSVPTFDEAGLSGIDVLQWWGVFAPASTPRSVIEKINKDINQVISGKEISESFKQIGASVVPMTTEEFQKFVRSEYEKWEKIASDFEMGKK